VRVKEMVESKGNLVRVKEIMESKENHGIESQEDAGEREKQ
jgi:hypothetical protein